MISSTHNPKIQWVRSLQSRSRERRESGAFVVEGVRLAEEALRAGWQAHLVLYTGDLDSRGQAIVNGFAARGVPVEAVAPHVMSAASDTQTPQGLLAVLEMHSLPLPQQPDFIFIADGVRDPGQPGRHAAQRRRSRMQPGLPAGRHGGRLLPKGRARGDGSALPPAALYRELAGDR